MKFINSVTSICFTLAFCVSSLAVQAETKHPIPVSGHSAKETESIDIEILQFIEKHQVPGMSVAMTVDGQLKYARGFGYGDLEKQEVVLPTSLFRIASLSKPITAVAILQLVEQKRLSLDDKIFTILDQYENQIQEAGNKFDQRARQVTIRHLLQHRGGWDSKTSFDPMFQSVRFAKQLNVAPPANSHQVITAMLQHPLDFEPGEKYAYSNYGYCLLGRLIEKVTSQTYEEYVQSSVLQPLGINTMRIGKTKLEGKEESEVRYYHKKKGKSVFSDDLGETVLSPYGAWYLEAMDSHGGWIGSAIDLARFVTAFDAFDECPILARRSIETMFARPPGKAGNGDENKPKATYYSLGWSNRILSDGHSNQWHNGSLPGTTTIMIRRHDGKNFIALLNTRDTPSSDSIGSDLDQLLHRAANKVEQWPIGDLFDCEH